MPFQAFKFQPGINREVTSYSNENGYIDCDKVRFRFGYPEKIGGWEKFTRNTFLGTGRRMHNWVALDSSDYLGLGTHLKYYIEEGQQFNDITPLRKTTSKATETITFSATNGSQVITVTNVNHNAGVGDFVTFSGARSLGGNITATVLNSEFKIQSVVNSSTYTIKTSVAANSSDTGNGTLSDNTVDINSNTTVTMDSTANISAGENISGTGIPASTTVSSISDATTLVISQAASTTSTNISAVFNNIQGEYQIGVGLDDVVGGTGWGAGTYGGVDTDVLFTTINEGGTFTNSDTTLTVTSGSGIAANDVIIVDNELMLVTNVSTNDLTVVRAYAGSGASTNVNTAGHGGTDSNNTVTSNVGTDAATHADGSTVFLVTGNATATDDYIGWGNAANVTVTTQIRLWSHDNYGEDLIINVRDGGIFYWDKTNDVSTRAKELSTAFVSNVTSVPTVAKQVIVSDTSRHVIAFGCDDINASSTANQGNGVQDPLLIRHSTSEDPTDFFPTEQNTADFIRIGGGSTFVQAVETKREILVFTDKTLHSLQFIGGDVTFGLTQLASNITIMSPASAASTEDIVYWMGIDTFYVHSGQTQQIPCKVKDKIFLDFNLEQRDKVVAGVNSEYAEIFWFYPSLNSSDNDKYVIYNYNDKLWYYGNLDRHSWLDRGTRVFPLATGKKEVNISNVTQANGAVVTTSEAHGLANDDQVKITEVVGMVELNNVTFTVSSVTATTFTLSTVDSRESPAYVSGGKVEIIGVSNLFNHEVGFDDDGDPMSAFIETAPRDIGDGDRFLSIRRVIPDLTFDGSSSFSNPSATFTIKARNFPGTDYLQSEESTVTRTASSPVELFTEKLDYRIRGRSFSMKVESEAIGCKFKLGTPRVDLRQDGRR